MATNEQRLQTCGRRNTSWDVSLLSRRFERLQYRLPLGPFPWVLLCPLNIPTTIVTIVHGVGCSLILNISYCSFVSCEGQRLVEHGQEIHLRKLPYIRPPRVKARILVTEGLWQRKHRFNKQGLYATSSNPADGGICRPFALAASLCIPNPDMEKLSNHIANPAILMIHCGATTAATPLLGANFSQDRDKKWHHMF